jgi:oxygen-dependent protoporphyrinogen oxidase
VAVIGGGISGLAAAHRLTELDASLDVVLLESRGQLGGVLETANEQGFLVEGAADSFLTTPTAAVDLCHRLGLDAELMGTAKTCRTAFVLSGERLLPVPVGFHLMAPSRMWPLIKSPILSWRGKLRAGLECLLPARRTDADESVQSFVCRRFGKELFERLVQPLVSGIYTGDPQRLSIEATFPRFRQMERAHGSMLRAMLRQPKSQEASSGARYGQFATLRGGMTTLVNALAERLPPGAVQLDSPVSALQPLDRGRWQLEIGGGCPRFMQVEGVIHAAPAHQGAKLLQDVDAELAEELHGIEYASCAVVGLGYRREQIGHPLNGFGLVVPLVEQRMILSCSFSSIKYPGRAPEDAVLMRVFIGGDCQSGLMRLSRDELIAVAEKEVAELLQVRGEPVLRKIFKHRQAMPQYHVGHRERIARIGECLQRFPSLALAGSALHGVGLPSCIQSGETAAAQVARQLAVDGAKQGDSIAQLLR